ncbi:DUF3466 family protein [Shewanella surugensis]|uniref:DUF3466 family protein n=1 Tax=Shewanella surugensis TaxID=212020 RepID=A0ABT0LI17_9GAMM|nr:DUF3466 family protein [Shewanella surugensis]MCL1127000.1 DUF3466 family protein [Shewanella surugensis]
MTFTLNSALSLVAVGVLSVLQTAHAADVYEVVNLGEVYNSADTSPTLTGTLSDTQKGFGMVINNNDYALGTATNIAKAVTDNDNESVSVADGIAPSESSTVSLGTSMTNTTPMVASQFIFTADSNDADTAWAPTFVSVNGQKEPVYPDVDPDVDPDDKDKKLNTVDSYFYGLNDILLAPVKTGAMTAAEVTDTSTGTTYYYRDYERRGFVQDGSDTEIELVPLYYEYTYTYSDKSTKDFNVGGWSVGTGVNNNDIIAGYASTEMSTTSKGYVDDCITGSSAVDACIQNEQYNGNIDYQIRGYVWQYTKDADTGIGSVTATALPLGATESGTTVYDAQGLAINDNDVVAGRSYVYRNNGSSLYYDAAYWTPNGDGTYAYNWIDTGSSTTSSIAKGINDAGIVVGSYNKYINGYLRSKFFYLDTQTGSGSVVTPNDFYSSTSDLSSQAYSINSSNQVVGWIESKESNTTSNRPKSGFLYNMGAQEFNDVNDLLTCESKGYEYNTTDATWSRKKVTITSGTGEVFTYDQDIDIVQANSINDNGVIVGVAMVQKPVYVTSNGSVVIGDNGLPKIEVAGNGGPVTSAVSRMVVLQKASSSSTACTESSGNENYTREGAASVAWLLMLPVLWFRRRFKL